MRMRTMEGRDIEDEKAKTMDSRVNESKDKKEKNSEWRGGESNPGPFPC